MSCEMVIPLTTTLCFQSPQFPGWHHQVETFWSHPCAPNSMGGSCRDPKPMKVLSKTEFCPSWESNQRPRVQDLAHYPLSHRFTLVDEWPHVKSRPFSPGLLRELTWTQLGYQTIGQDIIHHHLSAIVAYFQDCPWFATIDFGTLLLY